MVLYNLQDGKKGKPKIIHQRWLRPSIVYGTGAKYFEVLLYVSIDRIMAGGQESDFSWTHEKTFKLIFLFEKAPFLYNSRLLDYKDRNKRSDAIAKLARELETTGNSSQV